MKHTLTEFKKLIPELTWSADELAEKLSTIGHEAEASNDVIDVTLTSNRKDCQDIKYLAFDLAGVYTLTTVPDLISIKLGKPIAVTADDVNKILGSSINQNDLQSLKRLGFEVSSSSVTPPSFRDVATKADVAEEVVRIIGYDKLAIKSLGKEKVPNSAQFEHLQAIKKALSAAGLAETATYSFSSHGHVELKNPFNDDEPSLRESLQDGLLRTLAKNPYLKRAAFYEIGDVFSPAEETVLGIIVAGYKNTETMIGEAEQAIGSKVELTPISNDKCQKFDVKQGRVAWMQVKISELKPKKIEFASLKNPLPKFKPISKYPPLVRDITLLKSREKLISTFTTKNLLFSEQIDQYQENVTYRLLFQNMERSFTETEIQEVDDAIAKHFFRD